MFTKDTRTETFLTQMGVDWQYTNQVTIPELVPGWREINLSRPEPIREDAVREYAALMASNSPAPAPILHKTPEGYAILDGVQRIAAVARRDDSRLAAYLVTCDSANLLTAISLLANTRLQGRAEPPEWTRRRAVEVLVIERHMTIGEVAAMGGWRKIDIQQLADTLGWLSAVKEIGGPELPDTVLEVLAEHVTKADLRAAPEPTAKFLSMLKTVRLSAEDAEPYVEEFFRPIAKAGKRHEVLRERFEQFKASPEMQIRLLGRKGPGMAPDVNLRRVMKTVLGVLDDIQKSGAPLLFVDEFFQMAKDINQKLHTLAPKHPKPGRR